MKNKKMIFVVAIIVILGLGSILIPKFIKQQNKVKSADVKIGAMQMLRLIFTMPKLTSQK